MFLQDGNAYTVVHSLVISMQAQDNRYSAASACMERLKRIFAALKKAEDLKDVPIVKELLADVACHRLQIVREWRSAATCMDCPQSTNFKFAGVFVLSMHVAVCLHSLWAAVQLCLGFRFTWEWVWSVHHAWPWDCLYGGCLPEPSDSGPDRHTCGQMVHFIDFVLMDCRCWRLLARWAMAELSNYNFADKDLRHLTWHMFAGPSNTKHAQEEPPCSAALLLQWGKVVG
jgi:hypothetical protein